MHLQLEPALVGWIDRLEERRGLAGVDEHRNVQPRARLPDRIELGIVERHAGAVARLTLRPKFLKIFSPRAPGFDVGLELRCRPPPEPGSSMSSKSMFANTTIRSGAGLAAISASIRFNRFPAAAAQIDQHAQVQRVHLAHDLRVPLRRELPMVAVDVDDGILRARHGMRGHDERRSRLVLADREILGDEGRRCGSDRCGDDPGKHRTGASSAARVPLGCAIEKTSAAVGRKPNSVRLRLAAAGACAPAAADYGVTTIPLAPPLLAGSSDLPGGFGRAVLDAPPYLVLLRAGFCLPPVLPQARCALTAPFHPYRFVPVLASGRRGGMFSVPLSFRLPCPGVTRRTALRSSDFPLAFALRASARLARSASSAEPAWPQRVSAKAGGRLARLRRPQIRRLGLSGPSSDR